VIVTIQHLRTVPGFGRANGFCARGGRAWFARHGMDWLDFVRNGIDAEKLLATGCGFALALVEHARATEEAGHGQQ